MSDYGTESEEEDYDYDYNSDDDDDEEEDGSKAKTTTGGQTSNATNEFDKKPCIKMIPAANFFPKLDAVVKEVIDVLEIPAAAAVVLLRDYKWNKAKVLEVMYSCENSEELLRKHGVQWHCQRSSSKKRSLTTCPICYDDDDDNSLAALACGHEFCKDCLSDFCTSTLLDGPESIYATCPDATCTEAFTADDIAQFGESPEQVNRFKAYQLRHYVDSSNLARWCPGKGCENVASAPSVTVVEESHSTAHCDDCSISFCFSCGEEAHNPCPCDLMKKWTAKVDGDSMTSNWVIANTKPCPNCQRRIQKSGGCAHMTCGSCKHHFCWLCMGDWGKIGGYGHSCNVYGGSEEEAREDKNSEAARAKGELERYVHYHGRFRSHHQGQTFALEKSAEWKAVSMQRDRRIPLQDAELMQNSNLLLVQCRRALKYTYSYGYFTFGFGDTSIQKDRFEYHQRMLEEYTERLSGQTETALSEIDPQEVTNLSAVLKEFLKNILECVENGESVE